jgi:PRC-barrel domain protein
VDHPLPWLRYVDADDLDNQTFDFDGLRVRNEAKESLGKVDGFIVDSESGRPYYVVVDAGGWFKSKHYLLPVGHARMDADNDALVADLSKERIERFPGFDKDNFEKLSEADLRAINDEICAVTSVTVVSYSASDSFASTWDRPQYAEPSWWNTMPSLPERMGDAALSAGVEYPPSKVAPMTGDATRERGYQSEAISGQETMGTERHTTTAAREQVSERDTTAAAREKEQSPYFDGRAQPGDVIGLETGGEQTHIGETAEDENERRRAAEEAAQKRED